MPQEKRNTGRGHRLSSRLGSLGICTLVLLGCPDVQESVPAQLRGTWVAGGQLYEGRVIEIGRDEITFDSGTGEVSTHPVVGVFTKRLEGTTQFALDYVMDNGGEYRLHLTLEHDSGQMRWAGREQVVWTKDTTG